MTDWQKAEEHVERAGEMVRTGKWRDAERELRRATEIDPNRGEWHALLGSSLDALGRPEEALASIRQAAALMPEELDPLLVASEISQRLERWDEALEFAERAMDLDSEDDLIHALKISSLAAMSRNEDAEVAYFIAQQSLNKMPRCLIAMGDLQLSKQNLEQADWCYQEAMRHDSSIPRLRTRLASLFALMGKPQRALQLHMAELRENPASIDTLLECGSLLISMRRPLEAIEKFRRVLEVEPANVEAHWRIAQASLDLENFDQARVGFEVVRRLEPDAPLVRRRLAESLLGCSRPIEARKELIEAFDRVADDEPIKELERLAELMLSVDLLKEAKELLEQTLPRAETSPEILRMLSACRFRSGDRSGGSLLSRRVLRLEPNCVRSMHNLAFSALEEDRLISATRWVNRGLRIDSHDAGLRRVRSRVWARIIWLWTLGLPTAARGIFVKTFNACIKKSTTVKDDGGND
jgi:tetratricopeptide (TPR) repeat protein